MKKRCLKNLILNRSNNLILALIERINDMKNLLSAGAEKIIINSAVFSNPNLIREAADKFGSQSIIVSIFECLYAVFHLQC